MTTTPPDPFTNVHKGIRRALFAACEALGRAGDDPDVAARARALLAEALRFVAHHGENEDLLLLPLLRERAPDTWQRIQRDHAALDAERLTLAAPRPVRALYRDACAFTARYLAHLDDEERHCLPAIQRALTGDELTAFARESVARTAPADQRMMIGWMLPAMGRGDAHAMLQQLPPTLAEELRPLAG